MTHPHKKHGISPRLIEIAQEIANLTRRIKSGNQVSDPERVAKWLSYVEDVIQRARDTFRN
jgi:hypothetical protein